MKNGILKTLTATLLVTSVVGSFVVCPNYAYAETGGEINDIVLHEYYDDNGKPSGEQTTYVDIYNNDEERPSLDDAETMYRDAIIKGDTLNKWSQWAYQIYKGNSNTYFDWGEEKFDKCFGQGDYTDLVEDFQIKKEVYDAEATKTVTQSTGLMPATSFNDAIEQMCACQASLRERNAKTSDFKKIHEKHMTLGSAAEDNKQQLVYYTAVASSDRHGVSYEYGYNTMGLIFYDFSVVPLVDDQPYNKKVTNDGEVKDSTDVSYFAVNHSLKPTNVSQNLGTSQETNTSNTISNTQGTTVQNGFGVDIGVDAKFGIASFVDVGINIDGGYNWSTSELLQFEESNTCSHTETISETAGVDVSLPPHTQGELLSSLQEEELELQYDCPLGISYKVAIVSMSGNYYDDNALILNMTGDVLYNHHTFITVFGKDATDNIVSENAAKNLRHRALKPEFEHSHGYTKLYEYDEDSALASELWLKKSMSYKEPSRKKKKTIDPELYSGEAVVKKLYETEPMSATGANLYSVAKMNQVKVNDFQATKPLDRIKTVRIKAQEINPNTISVPVGGSYYLVDIVLNGYDEDLVPYYGFLPTEGKWELIDKKSGKPLGTDIAEIEENSVTKKQELKVHKKSENILLKYVINEDVYKAMNQKDFTKNSDLTTTAYVDVVVEGDATPEKSYVDVNDAQWYADAVDYMTAEKYMAGTSKTTFEPNTKATRAMAINILWNMGDQQKPKHNPTFVDLTQDWYKQAVAWGVEKGITQGTSKDTFSPNTLITREQMVTMMYRNFLMHDKTNLEKYVSLPEDSKLKIEDVVQKPDYAALGGDLSKFKDSKDVSAFAKEATEWAVSEGILVGDANNELNPKGTATRAEIATMLARYDG